MQKMEWKYRGTDHPMAKLYLDQEKLHPWPKGVWDAEPDKVQWPDEATNLPCLALRNRMGAWCGYVGLPAGHPWRELGYDDIPAEVHGGLTFGPSPCSENEGSICHKVEEGESDDVMWIGFDLHHLGDTSPGMMASEAWINKKQREEGKEEIYLWGEDDGREKYGMAVSYKTLAYVTAEVTSLAAQVENAWTH